METMEMSFEVKDFAKRHGITDDHVIIMGAIQNNCRKKPRHPWLAGWAFVPSYPTTLKRVADLRHANLVRAKTPNSSFVQLTPRGMEFLSAWNETGRALLRLRN